MIRTSRALATCLSLLAASLLMPASASPECEPILTVDPSPVDATALAASVAADGWAEVCGTGVEATASGQVCLPECLNADLYAVRFDPCEQPEASCPRGTRPGGFIKLSFFSGGAGPILETTLSEDDWACTSYPGTMAMRMECVALRSPPVGDWECYEVVVGGYATGAANWVKGTLACDQGPITVGPFYGPGGQATKGSLGTTTRVVCSAEGYDAYSVTCVL